MPHQSPLLAIAVAALLLTACTPPQQSDERPSDPVAAAEFGPSEAQEAAVPYIGLKAQEALDLAAERGAVARIGTANDVGQPGQVDDYSVGRLTFVLVDGVVNEVIVETETGLASIAAS